MGKKLYILNFARPLTADNIRDIEEKSQMVLKQGVIDRPLRFDNMLPYTEQAAEAVASIDFTPTQWQTLSFVINPPGYAPIALALVAELHGRMGHFPAFVRLRPVENSPTQEYEVAEVINLQALRDAARGRR